MRSASERKSTTPPVLTYVSLRNRPMTTSFPWNIGGTRATRAEAKVPGRADLRVVPQVKPDPLLPAVPPAPQPPLCARRDEAYRATCARRYQSEDECGQKGPTNGGRVQ